jgi:hypothetical protein
MDHDFFWLFNRYWWLIFPLFAMAIGLIHVVLHHNRANRALDILKSYADQGKDPPPELMKSLQNPGGWSDRNGWRCSPERRLQRGFLFLALAIGFGILTFSNYDDGGHWHHNSGLLIPMMIFAALALSNFLSLLLMSRGWPMDDKDRR